MERYFPMYVNLKQRKIVVIGGGIIGARRIEVLLEFGCYITVITKEKSEVLQQLEKRYETKRKEQHKITGSIQLLGTLTILEKEYETGDCRDAFFVLVATNDYHINKKVVQDCKRNNIVVNDASNKELCDFYFPGIIIEENVVIGVTASGSNHKLVKQVSESIRKHKSDLFYH